MSDWDYAEPFTLPVTVLHEHIDVLEHANNTSYINWCQDAAWSHSARLGVDIRDFRSLDRAMVVHRARYEYIGSAFENERLDVGTWLTATDGRMQMTRHFQIRRCDDGATLMRGDWDLVCVKLSTGKPTRMPEIFRQSYLPAVIGAATRGD
jgi:acyl-CoA thioester hydrolase